MAPRRSQKDSRDIYFRLAKSEGYRARSAFKLLQLDEEFSVFHGVQRAVDLCAAPGSWSQVLADVLNRDGSKPPAQIIAVDLSPMLQVPGVTFILGDITSSATVDKITSHFLLGCSNPSEADSTKGKADLVICDGAPDVSGLHRLDANLHNELLMAATSISFQILAPMGTFIAKIFRTNEDPSARTLVSQLRIFFPHGGKDAEGRETGVWIRKPSSSREGSGEAFVVARGFKTPSCFPEGQIPSLLNPSSLDLANLSLSANEEEHFLAQERKKLIGWAAKGDLSGWDT